MDTQQHTGWDPAAYLANARESDARYLTDTRDLINATGRQEIADVLTRTSSQRHEPTDFVIAAALGALGFRTDIIIRRLEQAQARIAELEAERDARVTGRDVLLGSMGTGNVHDDDEESLQFADESEWMDNEDEDA